MKTIALIDDDPIVHFIINRMITLVRPEISIVPFTNAADALNVIRQGRFTSKLIFLDVNLPDITGWQFMEAVKDFDLRLPVYMHSYSNSLSDKSRCNNFDLVADYIEKPLQREKLVEILNLHF